MLRIESNEIFMIFISISVIPKCEGEAIAAKFSCAFCETTAADDYDYVQQLFHRTVREVRKERERIVAAHSIDDESSGIHSTMTTIPSLSSSSSSNSSIHVLTSSNDTPTPSLNLSGKTILPKLVKLDSQTSTSSSSIAPPNHLFPSSSSNNKITSPTITNTNRQSTPPSTTKRTVSKPSVFSKIFK